jgi:glutamate-ammonia-ligase adenylyltransferase
MDEDRQTHTLPRDAEALDLLARKMPRESTGAPLDGETLKQRLAEHQRAVLEAYTRVVHMQQPANEGPAAGAAAVEEEVEAVAPASNLTRALEQRAPRLAAAAGASLHRGRERFTHFLEEAMASPEVLARLDADAKLAAGALDIFEHSAYFADDLLRFPELLDEIGRGPCLEGEPLEDSSALRRFYRRQMMRIQSESLLEAAPIFATLKQTSALADSVIGAAYRIALRDAQGGAGPRGRQMMVIALGRLGMSEFDLGSDADLIFVIPDEEAGEHTFWTGVAERIIQTMSAYTGEGVMFAVDTRLRPRGRPGAAGKRVQELFCGPCRSLGRHHIHEIAGGGRRRGTGHRFPARIAGGGLAPLRTEYALAQGTGGNAGAAGARAGAAQSIQGRPRRLLRYRFCADVPAAQGRGHLL